VDQVEGEGRIGRIGRIGRVTVPWLLNREAAPWGTASPATPEDH